MGAVSGDTDMCSVCGLCFCTAKELASPQSKIQKLFSFKTHTAVSPDTVQEESVTRTSTYLRRGNFMRKVSKNL